MKDLLRNILEQHGTLTIQDMIMHIVVAAILGYLRFLCLYACWNDL